MVNEEDRTARNSRSRLDLAGRLFRPHWPLFRAVELIDVGAARHEPRAATGPRASDSARHPLDVICGGMYRACSTWQYEVVAHLIEQYHGGQRLGYLTGDQYAALRAIRTPRSRMHARRERRWRVVKSHEGDRSFARGRRQGRALAVYAYRDVREVVFSLMHKRGMTFEQLLRQGMIHQILANDRFWMAQPDVLVQRYEDLLADPAARRHGAARHLGITTRGERGGPDRRRVLPRIEQGAHRSPASGGCRRPA